ncbi:hypothetical protein [Endozoicomonas lisbonensis]|uniref:Inverse autotransporter beta-domain domain-containing protein n=1 Tax=Endozoicomonas lisbonensis TaxID=3120522 RepID=A0ABV2SDV2_9GAMM
MHFSIVRKKTFPAISVMKCFFCSGFLFSFNASVLLSSYVWAAPPYLFPGMELNTPLDEWLGNDINFGSAVIGKRTDGFDLIPDKGGILNDRYLFLPHRQQEYITFPLTLQQDKADPEESRDGNPSSSEGASPS